MSQSNGSSSGYQAGVKNYADNYWTPDYVPLDTDLLAVFKVVPQQGVPREEAAAAVAAESSTGTWTTVWTDYLTDLDYYKGRAYRIDPVKDDPSGAFFAFVAYPMDLFEEGSIVNVLTSLVGNVFGFKAIRSLRLEDLRFPVAYVKTCGGPPNGIQVERDRLGKYGRRCWAARSSPSSACRPRTTGAVYECLRGGLDFTKDDENINSQPFMRWNHRYEFVMEAVHKATAETGERKGHYLNVTAATPEDMYERAEFAKSLGAPIIMHDYLTGGFCANTGLANWCRKNGMLLHIHRAMHAVIDRNPLHGIHFRVLAKCLRLSGGDHLHSGTVVGKLEGDREATMGWIDLMREAFVPENRRRGIFFDQDWGHRCPASFPLPPEASTSGTCPHWWRSSATTPACSSAAGRSATRGATHPAPTPTAWRSRPAWRHGTRAVRSNARVARS